MSKSFSTNVFVRGAVVFYGVTTSDQHVYQLTLQFCRLNQNPPPATIRIRHCDDGQWVCEDKVPEEFMFIAHEIGRKIPTTPVAAFIS